MHRLPTLLMAAKAAIHETILNSLCDDVDPGLRRDEGIFYGQGLSHG